MATAGHREDGPRVAVEAEAVAPSAEVVATLVVAARREIGEIMTLKRIWRHIWMSDLHVRRYFPQSVLDAIQAAIAKCETTHRGQIRFVIERELAWKPLLSGVTARTRAIEVFSQLRMWDTEENIGVLIYVLLADRQVEIVADRGIHRQVADAGWNAICKKIESEFRNGRFEAGVLVGIESI